MTPTSPGKAADRRRSDRERVLFLWDAGNDTLDIARVLSMTEPAVYSIIAHRKDTVRYRHEVYYQNRFTRKDAVL